MVHINRRIRVSMTWNAWGSISYQLLLFLHQLFLYKSIGPELYGYLGMLFALVYLISTILILGLESAITPYIHRILSCKVDFKRYLLIPFIKQIFITSILIMTSLIAYTVIINLSIKLTYTSYLVLGLLALSEAIRKLLRTLLNFMLRARLVALVELVSCIAYSALVGLGILLGYTVSICLVFIPLLITSFMANIRYGIEILSCYHTLPKENSLLEHKVQVSMEFTRHRIISALHTLARLAYSTNSLIPLFALLANFELAGLFKMVSSCFTAITQILQRIFGFNTQILCALHKNLEKHRLIIHLNKQLLKILSIIFGIFVTTVFTIYWLGSINVTYTYLIMTIGFAALLLSENFIVVYEKYCIAEKKIQYLLFYQSILIVSWYGGIHYFYSSPGLLLTAFFAIRLFTSLALAFIVHGRISQVVFGFSGDHTRPCEGVARPEELSFEN